MFHQTTSPLCWRRIVFTKSGFAVVLIACFLANASAQSGSSKRLAEVKVFAVDGFGMALRNTTVDAFVDESGHDLVRLFPRDRGTDVPYGRYRISVQANGPYRESTFDVEVNSPSVIITAALEAIGLIDNERVTGRLRGRLEGFTVEASSVWCKASGVYSHAQFESRLGPDWAFDFGEVPSGVYILSCTSSGELFVVRPLSVVPGLDPINVRFQR